MGRGAFAYSKQEEMSSARKKVVKQIYFGTLYSKVLEARNKLDCKVKNEGKKKQVVKKKVDLMQHGKGVVRGEL